MESGSFLHLRAVHGTWQTRFRTRSTQFLPNLRSITSLTLLSRNLRRKRSCMVTRLDMSACMSASEWRCGAPDTTTRPITDMATILIRSTGLLHTIPTVQVHGTTLLRVPTREAVRYMAHMADTVAQLPIIRRPADTQGGTRPGGHTAQRQLAVSIIRVREPGAA